MAGDVLSRAEVALKWVLRANGAVTVLALVAVFMPVGWMGRVHEAMGMGAAPSGAVFEYLARTVSAMYAIHGGLCFVLAGDVRRFGPVITYVGVVEMVFAGVLVWIDVVAGLPRVWVAVEGPTVVAVSGAILWLRMKARAGE